MNGAECLLRTLAANGVEVCFMNPGTSEMQFVSALDKVPQMRPVLGLFEGVCSGAADGYARMTRKPAATLLHLGPGLGNALSNFHNAKKARSPVVSIVGEHATFHLSLNAPLTADIGLFARTVSDDVLTTSSAAEMGAVAAEAIRRARRLPGQVAMLIVPADHSWEKSGALGEVVEQAQPAGYEAHRLETAREALQQGSSTALMLSGAVLYGPGLEAAGRIAAATGVKVFGHRYSARWESGRGRFQPLRLPYFPEAAQAVLSGVKQMILVESDPPVSFFGYPGIASELAPKDCRTIELASAAQDGTTALMALAEGLPPVSCAPPADLKGATAGPLTLGALGFSLSRLLPENAIVSEEAVSSSGVLAEHLLRAAPHDFLPVTGGSIGQGLPVAVGAAIACPDRTVISLEADGSAMYTLQALWTMAREHLDIVVVVLNNRGYKILEIEMERAGVEKISAPAAAMVELQRPDLDFLSLSKGMGVDAVRASTVEEFDAHFTSALQRKGPCLIEAVLSPG